MIPVTNYMKQTTTIHQKHIHLTGDLGVGRLEEIKAQLLSELLEAQQLHITVSEVTSLHLFLLQWIYAFGCAASTEGKEVTISLDLPAKFDLLVRAAKIKKMFNRFDP